MNAGNRFIVLSALLMALLVWALTALFTVQEREQALVLRFGAYRYTVKEPGLHFKLPSPIDRVVILDKVTLDLDVPPLTAILADQKRLEVDNFVRWRIADPFLFYTSIGAEPAAKQRISNVTTGALAAALGRVQQGQVLSEEREALSEQLRAQVQEQVKGWGIEIVDVRLRRANLPGATRDSVFQRMRSERQREAQEYRGEGQQRAAEIRAAADRQKTVLLATAEQQSQTLRGQGDRDAIRIYGEAYGRDPSFYSYYRSLEAYRVGFAGEEATLLLSPESELLRVLTQGPKALKGGGATGAR